LELTGAAKEIVAVVPLKAVWKGEGSLAIPFSAGLMRRGN